MEFKKKTIIWEDNNEPPKNYIWVKSDGNAYEFNHTTRQWEKIMSSNGSGSSGNGDSEYLSNVLELLYTPGIEYNFLTTDNIYTQGSILTKEEYQYVIAIYPGNTIGDYDTANYILRCYDSTEEEFTYICLTEEELNLLKEVVKTPQTITMKEYLETMIEFQYPNDYIYNNKTYPIYIPDLVFDGDEYVSTNDIPVFILNGVNFNFAYSTAPFNGEQKAAVIYGFDNDLNGNFGYINRVLIKRGNFMFLEGNNGIFFPDAGLS